MSFPWEIVLLAVLFAINRFVTPKVLLMGPAFWTINAADLAAAGWVYGRGFPGLEDSLPVRLMVGTLLVFHVAQNLVLRARAKEKALDTLERRREQLRGVRED